MLPKYSFVIPIFNEEVNLLPLYARLWKVMEQLDGLSEVIFIDDGSVDNSVSIIKNLREKDKRVCFLSLARNFGHQVALTAGLNCVRGNAIVILDGDLQDPPELIPLMIERWKEGNHVIYAERTYRHKEKAIKSFTAYLYYRVLNYLSEVQIPTDAGDFCVLDRKIVNILNAMPERNRYIRGLRAWVGFKQYAIQYEREPRNDGNVKYTFGKSFKLAMNGIFSFSKVPLRLSIYMGLLAAAASIIMAFLVLYWRVYQPKSGVNGFATILIVVFFIGAIQLISVGILGEYIGRIYEEVKKRPLYTVGEAAGLFEKKTVVAKENALKIVIDE